jgi:hypothetical protein
MTPSQTYRIVPVILLFLSGLVTSCKKFVEISPPQTQAESSRVFSSDATATAAVVGLYNQMVSNNQTLMNGAITIYTGLSSDEFRNVDPNSDYDQFSGNAIPANSNTINSSFWPNAYRYIYQANAVLEGLSRSAAITPSVKDQLRGEMLFTRALNYFYLSNLFGDVPLILTTDYRSNSTLPRTSVPEVSQQIIADLTKAEKLLSANTATTNNARPGRMAAAALLARMYLYQQNWLAAESEASTVIQSVNYTLASDLDAVFASTSPETIFQLVRPAANTAEGAAFIPADGTTIPAFVLNNPLLQAFESGDERQQHWLGTNTIGGKDYTYPYKYKVRSGATVTENNIVLRLAEVYLIRAEARAQQDKLSDALTDLNIIRHRAGLASITAATKSSAIQAIMQERQTELFAEWGHRWLDLKRTGKANDVLSVFKGAGWQPADALYPVPRAEILLNPFLTQNPGY